MKTALITGASTGIGRELALLFAKEGHSLVLVARNEQKLLELAGELKEKFGISVKVIPKDLSLARSPSEIFIELQEAGIFIDSLVNNAGVGGHGPFAQTDLDTELDMIQLNLVSLTHLTKLFLKEMLKRGSGKILNVASTAAFQPGPLMAIYYATKASVLSFSEALAEELRGTGVTVTCLCPGPTQTEFQERAGVGRLRLFDLTRMMTAEEVARVGYNGLMRGKRIVIPGIMNQLFVFLVRLGPRSLITRIVRSFQEARKNE